MFIHNFNPVLLSLGPLQIRYYGLVYVIGFLLLIWYMLRLSKEGELSLTKDEIYDLVSYLVVGVVIGGRLMHVIFFDPIYYLAAPWKIFFIWEGGMAFHGGAIGAALAVYFFAKRHKVSFYDITDVMVLPAAITLALGRVANFINGELPGRITDVWWAFKFPGYDGYRHPSQLYEAAKNMVIFGILAFVKTLKPKKGVLSWTFMLSYGVLRFIVEFWREPDWIWLGISAGQWLSIITVIVSAYMLYKILEVEK